MFEFTRGGTKYTIDLLPEFGDGGWMACIYFEGDKRKYRCQNDLSDLKDHYKNDEVAFMNAFLSKLKTRLDNAHGELPANELDPLERLELLIKTKLSFDGQYVNLK